MAIHHVVGSCFRADELFPSAGEEGKDVFASPAAIAIARELLGVPPDVGDDAIAWDLPDVFSVAYSSTRIGSASFEGRSVEFYFEE